MKGQRIWIATMPDGSTTRLHEDMGWTDDVIAHWAYVNGVAFIELAPENEKS